MLYWLNGSLVDEETYVLYLEATIRNVVIGINEDKEIIILPRKDKRFRDHKEMLNEAMKNINKNVKRKIERLKKGEGTKIKL